MFECACTYLVLNAAGYELKFYSTTYGQEGVFTFKNNMTAFHKRFNTPLFLQRWTFVAESSDSGTYTVEIYRESTGRIAGRQTIVLNIAAPLPDADLSVSCPPIGPRSVSCSSNGDSPQYSWSLDGRALSGADADLSADNQTVLLKGNVIGQLTCTVSNHVNTASITKLVFCPDILMTSIIALCVCVCLCTAVVACCICRRKRNTHTHTPARHTQLEMAENDKYMNIAVT
ncbi:uncharacterized protein LOC134442938 [Engraulis encrasicolus]|uniref:uncharacterized protein LOC134442938 n=1 Tax=Engraulis encrasicolus TaxID=184585 RepID=UPI002FCE96AF